MLNESDTLMIQHNANDSNETAPNNDPKRSIEDIKNKDKYRDYLRTY